MSLDISLTPLDDQHINTAVRVYTKHGKRGDALNLDLQYVEGSGVLDDWSEKQSECSNAEVTRIEKGA